MTHKEIAETLVQKYLMKLPDSVMAAKVDYPIHNQAKLCALVAVKTIIDDYTVSSGGEAPGIDTWCKWKVKHWSKVKAEIELL